MGVAISVVAIITMVIGGKLGGFVLLVITVGCGLSAVAITFAYYSTYAESEELKRYIVREGIVYWEEFLFFGYILFSAYQGHVGGASVLLIIWGVGHSFAKAIRDEAFRAAGDKG